MSFTFTARHSIDVIDVVGMSSMLLEYDLVV